MTDISEMAKGLRAFNEELLNSEPYTCEQRAKAAADALEAQAKEIEKLEEANVVWRVAFLTSKDRIAELEAALKETLAIAERNEIGEYQLRARAALKGEKG
jgi:predicted  nucleic acid-binding Zn-ribbon protein